MEVGQRIKKIRMQKLYTLTEFANMVGVSKQSLYKYENGIVTNIPLDNIERIAKALDVTPAYLMGWANEEEEERLCETVSRIKKLAKEKNISLHSMLDACGLSSSTINSVSNGRWLSFKAVSRIADFFNVSIDYLIGRTNFPELQDGKLVIDGQVIDGNVVEIDDGYIVMHPSPTLTIDEDELLRVYRQLNREGESKAKEYVSDLATIRKYITRDSKTEVNEEE